MSRNIIIGIAIVIAGDVVTGLGLLYVRSSFVDVYWELITPTPFRGNHFHVLLVTNSSPTDVTKLNIDFLVNAPAGKIHLSGESNHGTDQLPTDAFLWTDGFASLEARDQQIGLNRIHAHPSDESQTLGASASLSIFVVGLTGKGAGQLDKQSVKVNRDGGHIVVAKSDRPLLQQLGGRAVFIVWIASLPILSLVAWIVQLKYQVGGLKQDIETYQESSAMPETIKNLVEDASGARSTEARPEEP